MPESLQHVFVYDIAFWGGWDGWTYENSQPLLFLPCHLEIVLALHSVSRPPLHSEGTNSWVLRGRNWRPGDREPERWKERERVERQEAQGLVMGDFSRQFRGGRWKQLWGMKEVDERRKGISLSAMTSGCQSVVWGRLQVFEKCRR